MEIDRNYKASKLVLFLYVLTVIIYISYGIGILGSLFYALIDVTFVSFILIILPFIVKLIKKDFLSYKVGRRICFLNSFILFLISTFIYMYFEISFVTGVTAIIYYFVNMYLFVDIKRAK